MALSGSDGLIVFAHGSRVAEANQAVVGVAAAAAQRCGALLWKEAFLELAEPDLDGAVRWLRERGAQRIIVAPYFLTMGIHLKRDLPALIEAAKTASPGVEFVCAPPLDGHPALVDILADRAAEALAR